MSTEAEKTPAEKGKELAESTAAFHATLVEKGMTKELANLLAERHVLADVCDRDGKCSAA